MRWLRYLFYKKIPATNAEPAAARATTISGSLRYASTTAITVPIMDVTMLPVE